MNKCSTKQETLSAVIAVLMSADPRVADFVQRTRKKYGLVPNDGPTSEPAPGGLTWRAVHKDCVRFVKRLLREEARQDVKQRRRHVSRLVAGRQYSDLLLQLLPLAIEASRLNSYMDELASGLTAHIVSGLVLSFPPASLGDVLVVPLPGWSTPAVITYAYCNADADALAEEFRAKCQEAFGTWSVSWGQDPETAAYLLALKRQRLTYAQIFDRYRADRPDWFPWMPDDPEYEQKREESIDAIKKTVRRLKARLNEAVDRVDGGTPVQ